MDWFWIGLGLICTLVGIAGCILPVIPGPPISFLGLLTLQLKENAPFSIQFLALWALIALIVSAVDYAIPIVGTKKFGGSRKGIYGSMVGLLLGLIFFPPFGIIIGPFIGAVVGELMDGKESGKALKSAMGSLVGFFFGTVLKLIVSGYMAYYFFVNWLS